MGIGKELNKKCYCGSGKKYKKCCMLEKDKDTSIEHVKNLFRSNNIEDIKNEFGTLHLLDIVKNPDGEKFDPEKLFYRSFCNEKEIESIFNVSNTNDFLLKMRADMVADNTRFFRVMLNRRNKNKDWNFTSHFDDTQFRQYLYTLPEEDFTKLNDITAGFIYSDNPNGSCMKTEFGKIITVSESLKYFLYYMNLYSLDFKDMVPNDVRLNSLILAIRIMLQTEALDFDLDPRGNVPELIDMCINNAVDEQLQFVIGHEYAHLLLNHLDDKNMNTRPLLNLIKGNKPYRFYNHSQKEEFEADVASIIRPLGNSINTEMRVLNTLLFFSYIDIFENVKEQISPTISYYKEHPDPIDRIWNVYEKTEHLLKDINKKVVKNIIHYASEAKKILEESVAYNMDEYEKYGSVYLGSWRGKVLIDRVDY
ncbi:SEC-C domain-containing protein [Heliobacterium chlorum]|uniref:SEC-C domain-containing protein n=1 Tax=Heliobacterium chlorum TaxID=2698 RepID=A0ABR7T930_HELCL|nr:SEC-C metal-binding domain-containing protein [Heliobacterium chlorum]MBC9786474.1 SEC-C domain-containing protein [Heliobacterium chlorum]